MAIGRLACPNAAAWLAHFRVHAQNLESGPHESLDLWQGATQVTTAGTFVRVHGVLAMFS